MRRAAAVDSFLYDRARARALADTSRTYLTDLLDYYCGQSVFGRKHLFNSGLQREYRHRLCREKDRAIVKVPYEYCRDCKFRAVVSDCFMRLVNPSRTTTLFFQHSISARLAFRYSQLESKLYLFPRSISSLMDT